MYQPFTLNAYEGLNEDENPASLRKEQLREASNAYRLGFMTGTRPGLVYDTEYDAAISGDPSIQGIYEYRRNRDTARTLVTIADGVIHTSDTATLTNSGTLTSGAGNLWTFASYQDLLWAAGGASGDDIFTWDGSAGSVTPQLASLGITPQFVFQKFNALFLGGFHTGTDAWNNPLVARYVDYATDATDPLNWPNSNTIPGQLLGENSGPSSWGREYGTGFGSYQDNKGDFLLMLTNRRILAFGENPNVSSNANRFFQADAVANGCVSQHAFVDLGFDQGDAMYISESGIHSIALSQQFGQRENAFISWPIRKTWQTINRSMLKRFTAAYQPEEGLVLFAVATGSSTYLNLLLACDIQGASQISPDTVRWYKWNLGGGIQANTVNVARDPDGIPRIYVGGNAGEVAHFSRTSYSDLGSSIPVAFRGKDDDYAAPATEKNVGDTFFMVGGSGDYRPTLSYLVDDGLKSVKTAAIRVALPGFILDNAAGNLANASTLDDELGDLAGAGTLGGDFNLTRDRVAGHGSGFTLSHRWAHNAVNEPFFIGQITQEVDAQGHSDEAAA